MKWLRALLGSDNAKRRKGKAATAAATAGLVGVFALTVTAEHAIGPDIGGGGYPGTTTITFPSCPLTVETRTGMQSAALYQDNAGSGTWTLAGATFTDPALYPYPVRSESWGQGCIVGGTFDGPINRSATRDQWYTNADGLENKNHELRITMNAGTSWLHYQGQTASDMEDVFDPNAPAATAQTFISGANLSWVRDDCLENEQVVHNVYVNNSYMECFTAFAQRPSGAVSGGGGTALAEFVVENSLVYVLPQPLGPIFCSETHATRGRCMPTADPNIWLGAYGIWKWSDQAAATVEIRDTIFRLDLPSYSSCNALSWPTGTYENVTVVWADVFGQGDYASAGDCTNTLPAGVTLTTDVSVWTNAVADWNAQW